MLVTSPIKPYNVKRAWLFTTPPEAEGLRELNGTYDVAITSGTPVTRLMVFIALEPAALESGRLGTFALLVESEVCTLEAWLTTPHTSLRSRNGQHSIGITLEGKASKAQARIRTRCNDP